MVRAMESLAERSISEDLQQAQHYTEALAIVATGAEEAGESPM